MNIVFVDQAVRELYENGKTTDRKHKIYNKDKRFVEKLKRQIDSIYAAETYKDLYEISTLHYEQLKHMSSPTTSFRILNGYATRVICKEQEDYIELTILELDDTHYGTKQ